MFMCYRNRKFISVIQNVLEADLFLFVATVLLISCSQDNIGLLAKKETSTYSVKIGSDTQNMPSGGIITSEYSDSPQGEEVDKLLDHNVKTKFSTFHNQFYLIWKGDQSELVDHYSLASSDGSSRNDPAFWTLYGSADSIKWISLDNRIDSFPVRLETKTYTIPNASYYSYYKLEIRKNNSGAQTQFSEWTLGTAENTIDDLMQYSSGSTYSSLTPLGTHYTNCHITTAEDIIWLNNAINEPGPPASTSDLRLAEMPVTLYPYGTPSPADVNQHGIGDCGALAALASMAYVHPDFIMNIIKDNGDSTFTVSMYDPQGEPVFVKVSSKFLIGTDGKIAAVSGKNGKAVWSTILEKAIMKYNCIYKVNSDIGGIGSEFTTPIFTGNGNSFAFSPGVLSPSQLQRVVRVSLAKGEFVIGGFNRIFNIGNYQTVTGHAYTLSLSNEPTVLFSMRNPWGFCPGSSTGEEDGIMDIPNDKNITSTIDLRIIDSGYAGNLGVKIPYRRPDFKSDPENMRVSKWLMKLGF